MDRDDCIRKIRAGLRARKRPGDPIWSVKGGRGTAYGWIEIDAPPSWRTWRHRERPGVEAGRGHGLEDFEEYDSGKPGGHTAPATRKRLAELLGLDGVHLQGVSIPASGDYYREHVDRAEGRAPSVIGRPYWD